MSYKTVKQSTLDGILYGRIESCTVQEQVARGEPIDSGPVATMVWTVCTAADVEAAYASALAADNPDPGGDESVITDQMILSNVQANWPATP